jgi:hypothetical protein
MQVWLWGILDWKSVEGLGNTEEKGNGYGKGNEKLEGHLVLRGLEKGFVYLRVVKWVEGLSYLELVGLF